MPLPKMTPQAIGAFLILIVTNLLLLFGLDIGPAREAALETLLNGAAVLGFIVWGAVHAHAHATVVSTAIAAAASTSTDKTAGELIADAQPNAIRRARRREARPAHRRTPRS